VLRLRTIVALLIATLGVHALPSAAQPSTPAPLAVHDTQPAAGSVTAKGPVEVRARVRADAVVSAATLSLDDVELATAPDAGTTTRDLSATVTPAPGRRVARMQANLADGRTVERTWSFTVADLAVQRLGGRTRTDTARVVAGAAFPDGAAPAAVLARSDGFADALAGVGLAHALEGPLLLTAPSALDPATEQALTDSVAPGATVHLLGGEAALGTAVEEAVGALGFAVARIAGPDRYATAAALATATLARGAEIDDAGPGPAVPVERAVVASGEAFADALAVSPPAARQGWPVLLAGRDHLPDATREFLLRHDVDHVELIGGTAAVSAAVAAELEALVEVRRTAGPSRFDTAARIAARFVESSADDAEAPVRVSAQVVLASGLAFADALAGGVAAARWAAPLLLTADDLPAVTGAALIELQPAELVVLGGEAAVPERALAGALRAVVDSGTDLVEGPRPGSELALAGEGTAPVRLRLPGVTLTDRSDASVFLDDREVAISTAREADTLTVTVPRLPADLPAGVALTVRLVASLAGETRTAHTELSLVLHTPPATVTTAEGYVAIAGTGPVVGTGGPLRTYSLEVEPATGLDVLDFATEAEVILSDRRSWTAPGDVRLQRVEPAQAQIRVLLARPSTVDAVCARGGLTTRGRYSCWSGEFAALNLTRWTTGASGFTGPLPAYRGYLVNHEVGHALGHDHVGCPRAGALAPVMMQQTVSTGACLPNPWPYPVQ
jgi:putative cell wall-binding protein